MNPVWQKQEPNSPRKTPPPSHWAGSAVSKAAKPGRLVRLAFQLRHSNVSSLASAFVFRSGGGVWHSSFMAKAPAVKWTREHFLIALNLYCKIPFGQLHKGNPIIIETAARMGRSANSLAMKLCNFASLDPVQRARGIRGLPGATKQDRAMWDEFTSHTAMLAPESEELLHDLFTKDQEKEVDFLQRDRIRFEPSKTLLAPMGATESTATVRIRRGQQFFRQAILNAYGVRCCITGISVPRLLVASHIMPWSDFPEQRLNPRNGLCLCSLHDAAFDAGLIALDDNLNVVLSKRLRSYFPQPALEQNFVPYEGRPIRLPDKLAEPAVEYISFHREKIFIRV